MQHKISDLIQLVDAMHDKATILTRLKYDTPKHQQDQVIIDNVIADIQMMAGLIYNDRAPYTARSIDEDFDLAAM